MRVVVITHIPSPYQVELFDALATAGLDLLVVYVARCDPGRNWQPRAFAHRHAVLPETDSAAVGVECARATLTVFCTYQHPQVRVWMRQRARAGKPWCFWGERPGARATGWAGRCYRRWHLRELHHSHAPIWGIGTFGVEGYQHEFGRERHYINLPYFSDLERFEPESLSARREGGVRILYSGSLTRRKGVDLLAASFAQLTQQHRGLELHWLGTGDLEDALRLKAQSTQGQVVFHGFKDWDALPAHYHDADLLVAPSRYDGWGLIVPEALAAGLPVIGTERMGAARELIAPGGNGWRVEADSQAALTHALEAAVARGAEGLHQLGCNARKTVVHHQLSDGVRRFLEAIEVSVNRPRWRVKA